MQKKSSAKSKQAQGADPNYNNIDTSNAVDGEVLSYAEQVEQLFLEMYREYDVANCNPKDRADIIDSFWGDIYKQVFKPDRRTLPNNQKSKVKYWDVDTIDSVLNTYISLCKRFGGVILIDGFSQLIGIHRATFNVWTRANKTNDYIFNLDPVVEKDESNYTLYYYDGSKMDKIRGDNNPYDRDRDERIASRQRLDVAKKIKVEQQRQAKNHTSTDTVGWIFRSNNEDELGFRYDAKRTFEQEQIKQLATAAELPKFGQIAQNDGNNNVIAELPQFTELDGDSATP